MRELRQNTATRVTVGPFVDATDGITAEVALTATNEALTLVVDTGGVPTLALDAAATASGGDNDLVHITGDNAGYYDLELTAAQLNYLGRAVLSIQYPTDHCPVFHEFMILDAEAFDAKYVAGRMARDLGIVCRGTVAAAGNTTAFTLGTVTSGALTDIQVGDIVKVAGLPGRIVKTINTGTGAATVTTALASDPSSLAFVVFGQAPADSTIPVPADMVAGTGVPVTPAALAVPGTATFAELLAYGLGRAGGMLKRTFNKSTGVETQRNAADNATLGTATHADDGTTVTRNKLA